MVSLKMFMLFKFHNREFIMPVRTSTPLSVTVLVRHIERSLNMATVNSWKQI